MKALFDRFYRYSSLALVAIVIAGLLAGCTQAVVPSTQGASAAVVSADGHSHDGSPAGVPVAADGPDWTIIGGFAAALALVIGVAAVTKPKAASARSGTPTPEGGQA